eukprot:9104388-Alexandrium_andersonii.AAC.1
MRSPRARAKLHDCGGRAVGEPEQPACSGSCRARASDVTGAEAASPPSGQLQTRAERASEQ